jgi:hypothetical protein
MLQAVCWLSSIRGRETADGKRSISRLAFWQHAINFRQRQPISKSQSSRAISRFIRRGGPFYEEALFQNKELKE